MAQCHLGATVRRARSLAAETMTTGPERGTRAAGAGSTASERELLKAARRGDDDAFGRLAGPYRGELYALLPDARLGRGRRRCAAGDAAARLARPATVRGPSSVRSWLYKIATNACRGRSSGGPDECFRSTTGPPPTPTITEPVTEAVWLEPYPDARLGLGSDPASPEARYEQREGVELAFIALQHLPARQRAVLILRDVLGFSARETATALETTPVSVDSALQRPQDRRPTTAEQSQQATLRSLSDDALRQLVQRYVTAWSATTSTRSSPCSPKTPSWPCRPCQPGTAAANRSPPSFAAGRWRDDALAPHPARANGQLAFGLYAWDDKTQTFTPRAIDVLTLRGAQIQEITAFLTPAAFPNFDLPAIVPASGTNS